MSTIRAWAATESRGELRAFEYDPGPLGAEQVEIRVEHCGICHSDLSMLDNDWGRTRYPFVPGHEVVGRVVAAGERVQRLAIGDRVGLGWYSGSCMSCPQCLAGHHNLCQRGEETLIGRHGGFAERVRCHWLWAAPLPEGLDASSAGPMFCGGITVFNPILECQVLPTERVGVIGIGGLGHLALKFLRAWGCEVTAFTSNPAKADEAKALGAHRVVGTSDAKALANLAGQLDFLLVTVNVTLDWPALLGTLAPHGRLHVVGAVLEPMKIPAFALIGGSKRISGSPLGSPALIDRMLEFSARHDLAPQVERFAFSRVNEAIEHLRAGKARYRVVLEADWA
jgi:alcohol/geraniol dehydrogenase (NADP+)